VTGLKHVVELAETLLDSSACLVVLERICCSWRGDVRPAGGRLLAQEMGKGVNVGATLHGKQGPTT
jgi:hypothetical protein